MICRYERQASVTLAAATTPLLLILVMIGAAQLVWSAEATCWPVGELTFPAGARDAVIARATEFLINEEDIPIHPYWPQGSSGITLGVGWDAGYHTNKEIRDTWAVLGSEAASLLQTAAGQRGQQAKPLLSRLRTITVPRSLSRDVLMGDLRDHYYSFVVNIFPGLERLPTDAQVVFISVVFNRGQKMGHDPDWRTARELDRRWEMRRIRADVARYDLFAVYAHLGTMKRLWEVAGPRGLLLRRRDEQALLRPYVNAQFKWEEARDKLKEAGLPPCPQ